MNEKIFPTVLIALDFLAGVVYATHGDVRRCVYWIAAAVLTITVSTKFTQGKRGCPYP